MCIEEKNIFHHKYRLNRLNFSLILNHKQIIYHWQNEVIEKFFSWFILQIYQFASNLTLVTSLEYQSY